MSGEAAFVKGGDGNGWADDRAVDLGCDSAGTKAGEDGTEGQWLRTPFSFTSSG